MFGGQATLKTVAIKIRISFIDQICLHIQEFEFGFKLLSMYHTVLSTIYRKTEIGLPPGKQSWTKIGKNKHRTTMKINRYTL